MKKLLWLCSLTILMQTPAYAFYVDQGDSISQEARGMFYGAAGSVDASNTGLVSARLMYDGDMDNWHLEYHQIWQQLFTEGSPYNTEADRLNFSYSDEALLFKVGRQPLNLATTFFFSPNDFFAPFTVQAFNRDFKQGVDAIYGQYQFGELSQLSAMLVNNHNEDLPTSSVVRFESAFANISWMMLAGEINGPLLQHRQVVGGSIQTDLFDSIGLRAEANTSSYDKRKSSEWVIGLEHRRTEDFTISMEWFNHGAGAATTNLPYFGRRYVALGLSYTFTPLLSGSYNLIRNMSDLSQLHSIYLNYSLSDESTLSVYALQPTGDKLFTEFGSYAATTGLELISYF